MKDKTLALILSVMLGGLGIDRFYLGYTGIGVLKLLTGGCFGVLWIIDIINIATGKLLPADGSEYGDGAVFGISEPAKNPADELKKIKVLYDEGVLTDEEFATMKADILKKM